MNSVTVGTERCPCKREPFHYRAAYDEIGAQLDWIWLHSTCALPSQAVWEGFRQKCSCGVMFSSPLEESCRECEPNGIFGDGWRSWWWLRAQTLLAENRRKSAANA
jgi:hypothetical protein